jgi:protocatechuate 3,4-dioxygenase beta subunit
MNRKVAVVVGVVAVVIAIVLWRSRGGGDAGSSNHAGAVSAKPVAGSLATAAVKRPDPQKLARGSLAGTITDEATKAPLAHARVCAAGTSHELADELLREPACIDSDAQGRYTLAGLYPAAYRISASAKTYRPAIHHPNADRKKSAVQLAAGQNKTGIDVALRGGGALVTGVVSDLTGGPIARAHVDARDDDWSAPGPTVTSETDDQGVFAVWVNPGGVRIEARAEGYADNSESVHAPGKVEILLTPESSVSGTVVDAASGQPVEGARVMVGASEWGWESGETTFTNAAGGFRVTRLTPGRVVAIARTEHGYGRTEGSTLIGLGQHVDGVIVKLFPAHRLEGKVLISERTASGVMPATTKAICEEPRVSLRDQAADRSITMQRRPDNTLFAEGVLPGTYTPEVECRGSRPRDKYDPITIADKDATDLVWEVDAGAIVRGKVSTRSGEAVEGAHVWARTTGGAARDKTGWGGDTTARDGRYELTGLRPGTYKAEVSSDKGIGPKDGYKIDVAAGAIVEQDLVLEDGGTIKGTVVDAGGKPVSGVEVSARSTNGAWSWGDNQKSDDAGSFTLDGLRPGDYRVTAQRSWSDQLRKPGTTDDAKQGEKVAVRPNQTATVRLVVESQSGWIEGVVIDTDGKPVPDAFVSAARESDAAGAQRSSVQATRWAWDEKPVLTSTDGTFTVGNLSPGTFTVRAYRKGGGEAVAEHVAASIVAPGTAKLQIKSTGSIEGTATRASGPPEEIEITMRDLISGFWRGEKFYMTKGHFVIHDVPKGHFQFTVESAGSMKKIELDLAEGEAKTGVEIELEALITLTGRVVELGSQKPVPGLRMYASEATGGAFSFSIDNEQDNISDEAGKFTIKNSPKGKLMIRGWPKDGRESDYQQMSVIRTALGSGTVDVGDLPVLKKRVKQGDPVGELGINFAEQPRDTLPDKREYKVSWIDPAGPAATTEIKVGDILITVDGLDITGANSGNAWGLLRAAPGTKLALGLQHGATISLVLAAP